jgi:hypothetical protein
MQNRYFGDVGDYGKYGLLRFLCGLNQTPRLRLGVVWYLYPDESHNEDGKHLGYLRDSSYRLCDETLYDGLREALLDGKGGLRPGSRQLGSLGTGMLPDGTIYYGEPLSFSENPSLKDRRVARHAWFAGALEKVRDAELVFLDPDNGIECASVRQLSRKGPKYVYWADLEAFVERGQSLVIYHHLNRSEPHAMQVKTLLEKIRLKFPEHEPMATIFRRGTGRAYFILPAVNHLTLLRKRLDRFAASRWSAHFVNPHSRGLSDSKMGS